MTIAFIGGSGLYDLDLLDDVESVSVETPFGSPSCDIIRGRIGDSEVLFLARHGKTHSFLPADVPYRANIYALKKLGAQFCIALSAVGSLKEELRPGDFVVPDQLIDRTKGRTETFFGVQPDTDLCKGIIVHVSMADPFCTVAREVIFNKAKDQGLVVHQGGTYICMQGPAFSSRAESKLYRSWGCDIIGMTACPEAKLAREAQLSYALVAMVTDYDCWKDDQCDVQVQDVLKVLAQNSENAKKLALVVAQGLQGIEPSSYAKTALQQGLFTSNDTLSDSQRSLIEILLQ